jgi:hypothetical protein
MSFQFTAKDEDELNYFKDKALKLKVILLEKKGHHPLKQISLLTKRDRDLFKQELMILWETMADADITEQFNAICCGRLFDEGVDVSNYSVSSIGASESDAQAKAQEDLKIETVKEGEELL